MADTDRLAKELAGILRSSGSRQTKAYDTPAEVRRIDGSTAWVHIPGGVDETPVQLTIAASVGDTVQVRVSGGRAWMVGNASAPPTDDTVAVEARGKAEDAAQVAEAAEIIGTEARATAQAAARIAADTEQHFWFTSTGADTGAHITEVTQDDFLADPDNGGGNLLARSNGVAVRDGLRELSTFSGDGFTVNNTYDKMVLETGFSPDANYSGVKYDVFDYNNESPFTMTLPWDIQSGYEGNVTYTFYSTYPGTIVTGITVTGHWSVSGRDVTFDATLCTSLQSNSVTAVRVQYYAKGRFPFYTLGTRGSGTVGAFSTVIGENGVAKGSTSLAVGEGCDANGTNAFAQGKNTKAGTNGTSLGTGTRATWDSQVACGFWNIEHSVGPLLIVGDGSSASARSDSFIVGRDGNVYLKETDATVSSALSSVGWGADLSDNMLAVKDLLEHLLKRLALYDKSLSMSVASWTTGNCTVTNSSKYRVFEIVQGGASCIAIRYGNDVRGFAISGNSSSGNYNQYIRAFGATVNWSTEVWTMSWAKQLSHVTTSSYHTSGAEQAVTEIRGLIPLYNA